MSGGKLDFARSGAAVFGVAAAWMGSFTLNEWALAATAHSSRANWVFLPAAVRLLAVLLFGELGALGLAIGSLCVLLQHSSHDLGYNIGLAVSSGMAPLAAVYVCRRFMQLGSDLAGLRPQHIITLSVASALANAVMLNSYMAAMGRLRGDIEQVLTVFVGDTLGTAIVLFVLSNLLAFALPRRAQG